MTDQNPQQVPEPNFTKDRKYPECRLAFTGIKFYLQWLD